MQILDFGGQDKKFEQVSHLNGCRTAKKECGLTILTVGLSHQLKGVIQPKKIQRNLIYQCLILGITWHQLAIHFACNTPLHISCYRHLSQDGQEKIAIEFVFVTHLYG